jgi:antidote-toxin recognition MazE-like antitoxin
MESVVPSATRRKATRDKVAAHRARLRAQGLRPIQLWVPDTRSPEFAKEARRQSRAVARSAQEADDIAFVESLSVLRDE